MTRRRAARTRRRCAAGTATCLDIPDVDAAHAALLAAGAADRMTPRASPEPGVRMAFVADPEGNLIELIDRTASRARER